MNTLYYVELFRQSDTNTCYWSKVFNSQSSAKKLYRQELEYEASDKIENYKIFSDDELIEELYSYIRRGEMAINYEFYLICEKLEIHD